MGTKGETNHTRPSSVPTGQGDRRSSSRYVVVEDQAWLGWWDGPSYVTAPCRILDLSIRGALLEIETLPAADRAVWFCPPETAAVAWLEARLVQRQATESGRHEARIAFQRIVPYEMFKSLVYGRSATASDEADTCLAESDNTQSDR